MTLQERDREISTIKPREYKLNLSDADIERLAVKALRYGISATELLENFIGDLVDGTYSNGSDERMYASEWANRCFFAMDGPEKNLTTFLFCEDYEGGGSFNYEYLEEVLERIEDAKKSIRDSESEISNPTEKWADITEWDTKKGEYVQAYSNVEEYLEEERACLSSYQDYLEAAEQELEDIKEEFNIYMKGKEYSWESQVEACREWYKNNVEDMMNSSNEKSMMLNTSYKNGRR